MIFSRRLFVFACMILTLVSMPEPTPAQRSRRPNLLIIQTDEHHFGTLGCYGSSMFSGEESLTPNLDKLAAEGAIATSFYATTPVCSPSRACFMTGRYPHQTPVVQNNIPMSGQLITFSDNLKSYGYFTGYSGKWHLDGDGKPQWAPQRQFGWSDNRFMFNRGHWKRLVLEEGGPDIGAKNAKGDPSYGLEGADSKTFTTDWLIDRTIEFIDEHAKQPFCYMVALPDPHGPNSVREPYDTMYSAENVVIPDSLHRDNSQIPAWGTPDKKVSEASLKRIMPEYFGMVKCIDDNVGRVLETLDKHKILNDTIIVFTSDHGDLCGEHGKLNKGNPYEGSARIPFLVRYPKAIPAGTEVNEALSCVDFFPTVMKLMGLRITTRVPGRDASALFRGSDSVRWTDVTVLRSTSGGNPWLAVVSDDYKLVYSSKEKPWLFDLKDDPQELTNQYTNPDYKKIVILLTDHLKDYLAQQKDPYGKDPDIQAQLSEVPAGQGTAKLELYLGESKPAPGLKGKRIPDSPKDIVYIGADPVLSNEHIAAARPTDSQGSRAVEVEFTTEGSEIMLDLTKNNNGKRLVIVLNGRVVTAPYIRSAISEKAVIVGTFSAREISQIVNSMNALPQP